MKKFFVRCLTVLQVMDEAVRQRQLLIARAREAQAQRETPKPSSESSSEDSSSCEEPEVFKPVFVPRAMRSAVESSAIEPDKSEEREIDERMRSQILQQALIPEDEGVFSSVTGDGQPRPPPIGDEDTEENYQQWRLREFKRILKHRSGQD